MIVATQEKRKASGAQSTDKAARRDAAAIEACVGIPTETLEKIAALPVAERPAALAEAAG
jgi:hypothetical protein